LSRCAHRPCCVGTTTQDSRVRNAFLPPFHALPARPAALGEGPVEPLDVGWESEAKGSRVFGYRL
jgi:hypothetical protein